MDISICFADFPTEAIGETTRKYRQLGIGYANLGALLMATGHGYDSDGGRALAASITSLMTGTAYKRSAELAGVVGPYEGYARNADAAQAGHAQARRRQRRGPHARRRWTSDVHARGHQGVGATASSSARRTAGATRRPRVLAPTGTIGFMMDCDTTGIEPDFSLVKFKKLVGGGSMQIVNQTIPRALRKLGYTEETVEAIVEYIAEHGHVIDAPGLRQEHYEVFDCAMGERAITPMGHVRMMAAVQPFLSGAISKTVNLPETATVEEIEDVYFQGWKLGLKALAVYRDNCKVGQPLSDGGARTSAPATPSRREGRRVPADPQAAAEDAPGRDDVVLRRRRRGLHDRRRPTPTTGSARSSSRCRKQGSTLAGVMDAFSIAISIGLQYGVPLETYVSKFINMRFEPAGLTDDPDVRMAQSIMDYIFRRLALDYLRLRRPARRSASTPPRSGPASSRPAPTRRDESDEDVEEELETLAQSAPVTEAPGRGVRPSRRRRSSRRPRQVALVGRAARGHHRPGVRRAAVLHLRHQDAPGRLLLRLRGLRQHQRLQLMMHTVTR